jgi:hypothetical protein
MPFVKGALAFSGSPGKVISLLSLLVMLTNPDAARADSCAPPLAGVTAQSLMSSIKLVGVSTGRPIDGSALTSATSNWNNSCAGFKNPDLRTSGTADITVNVHFRSGNDMANGFSCSGKCACTQTQVTGGRVSGAVIQMFEKQGNGTSCTSSQSAVLTHEVGHVLGLGDSNCSGRIMGDISASVGSGECVAVDDNFLTAEERTPPAPNDDGHGPCGI